MLVAIEGPDGSGKSTLVENLRDNSRRFFAIIKASGPPKSEIIGAAFTKAVIRLSHALTVPVITDRCVPISDSIYSSVLRGAPMPTVGEIRAQILDFDLIVYCRPPTETIRYNLKQNLQMSGVIEKIDEIVSAYDILMDQLQVRRFNYLTDPLDVLRQEIFQ